MSFKSEILVQILNVNIISFTVISRLDLGTKKSDIVLSINWVTKSVEEPHNPVLLETNFTTPIMKPCLVMLPCH